jgi:WD40 repeat protein
MDMTVKLWSLPDGRLLKTLEAYTRKVSALTMSSDGKLLASGSMDMTVKLWSLPDGRLLKTLEGHTAWVYVLAMSSDARLLASGNYDNTLRLWSLSDGTLKACLMDLAATPNTVEGIQYKQRSEYGIEVTYTLPCHSPIPPGAICVCNCVRGSYSVAPTCSCVGYTAPSCSCVGHTTGYTIHYWYPN